MASFDGAFVAVVVAAAGGAGYSLAAAGLRARVALLAGAGTKPTVGRTSTWSCRPFVCV